MAPKSKASSALLLAALLLAPPGSSSPTTTTTTTTTTTPSTTSAVPDYVDDATFQASILNSTNVYRGEHNATAVVWNTTLAEYAASYLNSEAVGSECKFAHSGGPFGENLALGYPDATRAVEGWGDERAKYNFAKPGFSAATGHFTQLVWKSTTDVGCGRRLCDGRGWYLACEYWPPGNVIGAFKDQVDRESGAALRIRAGWLGFVSIAAFVWMLS
ncbi:CAP domain-containing protein [Xylaria telfairii]|nr:CAP domain-containing protein [Xylaria telfairii]